MLTPHYTITLSDAEHQQLQGAGAGWENTPSSSPRARPSSSGPSGQACPISRSPRRWAPRAIWYRSGASALPSIFRPRLHSGRPSVPVEARAGPPGSPSVGSPAGFFPRGLVTPSWPWPAKAFEERDFWGLFALPRAGFGALGGRPGGKSSP